MIERILREQKTSGLKEGIQTIIYAAIESKRQNARFTRIFAQKVFTLEKVDLLKRVDDMLIAALKLHLAPFASQIRTENLDLSLNLIIQTIKLIPVALLSQEHQQLEDPRLVDELVHMVHEYLKKRD